ncbi:MAG TPA: 30S ribosome-binding factor RbfA [Anaerolineales bacterium]|nr:30S ribosome-binding factor RbfA [Anaerolineales bacterium]HRQ92416.1 30S ribosome-binding factor RbfA [Anaerolineales bacterium]
MVSLSRAGRIGKRMRELLSEMLLFRVTDPRLSGIFVTDVNVDRELSVASIFVSALEGVEREREVLAGLKHASGFLRSELAREMDLRTFPRLRFVWDPTPERAERIEQIIAEINKPKTDAQPDKPDEAASE